jgi:hypothetical protein
MNLLGFIQSLIPHISKNDVLEDIRITRQELESTTIPATSQAAEHFKITKIKSQNAKDLVNIFYRNYDLAKQSSSVNIAAEIAEKLQVVLNNLKFVEKEFENSASSDIIAEGVTVKKAVMLRTVDQTTFISRFTMDFLTVLYRDEALEINPEVEENISVPKIVIDRVEKYIALYANLLSIYGDKSFDFEKRFASIPDVIMSERTQEAIVATYGESKLDPYGAPAVQGFLGNPIYHIRLLVAEWQANRYKAMKDKKKMLEMRLMHLQLLQENKNDAKLEQEISYIQSRVDKIEYSMAKAERSVE